MNLGSVLAAVFRRDWTMLKRYIVNSVSSLVSIYMIFILIFAGLQSVSKYANTGALEGSLEGTIVGFFVWTFTIYAFSNLSWNLMNEAQTGTLEQLYLAPCGFKWVGAATLMSDFVFSFVPIMLLLFAMMATTGRWLRVDMVSLVPLLLITLLGAYGVGFALGGLALVFKRIQALFQIMQFVFIGLLVIPVHVPGVKCMPLALGNDLIRTVMVDGVRLWRLPPGDIVTAAAVGAVYLAVGIVIFSLCERVARNRGLLGHY
ncbi:MAG: ABC transporter permease [Firmicutes bacterium]|nr:ABC transporter permease [Bacillota bacterium]